MDGIALDGCISWFRAYHIGKFADNKPERLLGRLQEKGLELVLLDPAPHNFYELSTLRDGQIARGRLPQPCSVEGNVVVDGVARWIRADFDVHVIVHRSGFVVLRPTVRISDITIGVDLSIGVLHALERTLWKPDADLHWRWSPTGPVVTSGWGRNFLNYMFLDLMARWAGRRIADQALCASAVETATGCDALHALYEKGVLEYPYPLTFGVEVQVALPDDDRESGTPWKARADAVGRAVMQPLSSTIDVSVIDVEPDAPTVSWYLDENRAVVVVQEDAVHPELGVIDVDRTQLLEYLTIRRAALSSVRRASQRVLIEGLPISRELVGRWRYLVTATTDDYVLDARIGGLLQIAQSAFASHPRLRDLHHLEHQVSSNLEAFQSRIDTAAEWTGGLVGALVGAGALVIGLQDAVRMGVALVIGVSPTDVTQGHLSVLVAAQLALVAVTFVASYFLIRHMSDNLKTVDRRRVWRAPRRRVRRRASGVPSGRDAASDATGPATGPNGSGPRATAGPGTSARSVPEARSSTTAGAATPSGRAESR